MKLFNLLALLLAMVLCFSACQITKTPTNTPEEPSVEPNPLVTPNPESNIPPATTDKEPTKEGETYTAVGMYLGMADNNLMVIIEANPEDGKPEKSYHISPDFDLAAMGIQEGSMIELTYTVDENGIKKVKSVSAQY